MLIHQATDVVNEPSLLISLVYDVNFVGVVNKVGNLDILCMSWDPYALVLHSFILKVSLFADQDK